MTAATTIVRQPALASSPQATPTPRARKMVHVPYRAAGAVFSDLVGGQVDVLFGTMIASIEYVKAGTLRALAVTSARRLEALPGIPTVDETLPGYETTYFGGIVAPKATPAEIVGKLNKEIN